MAIYRNVHMSFWTDSKVTDDFTPEDKLFFLYVMTNPKTSLCGCYECSKKQMSRDLGYSQETISNILYRMDKIHNSVKYNEETKEVLILNWGKYNWKNSPKVLDGAYKGATQIKSGAFKYYVLQEMKKTGYPVPEKLIKQIEYQYSMDITVTFPFIYDTDSFDNNSFINQDSDFLNTVEVYKEPDPYKADAEEIVAYLNEKTGSNYRPGTEATKQLIRARLKEGNTVDDFKKVIDIKTAEWLGTEQEKYLRPITLFSPSKFESYLNQKKKGKTDEGGDKWSRVATTLVNEYRTEINE